MGTMTARTATVRLYVAFASLVAAVLALLTAAVRLVASLATWLAARVDASRTARVPPPAEAPARPVEAPAPALRLVPQTRPSSLTPSKADQLKTALVGLGFKAPPVCRFVASLGARVDREPLEGLIKEGLRALSSAVAS